MTGEYPHSHMARKSRHAPLFHSPIPSPPPGKPRGNDGEMTGELGEITSPQALDYWAGMGNVGNVRGVSSVNYSIVIRAQNPGTLFDFATTTTIPRPPMTFHDTMTLPLAFQSLHPSASLPAYATPGSAALDLKTVESGTVPAHGSAVFATGLAVAVPEGFVVLLFSRSGHGFRYGLRLSNCVGVIDSDYRGEVMVSLHNDSPTPFSFEPGDRIAQAILLPIPRALPSFVPLLSPTVRGAGGFGSTGA